MLDRRLAVRKSKSKRETYDNRLPVVVEDLPERKTCKDVKHKCQTGHDTALDRHKKNHRCVYL